MGLSPTLVLYGSDNGKMATESGKQPAQISSKDLFIRKLFEY